MKVRKAEGGKFVFWCPGCECAHAFNDSIWKFNGDLEKPTVRDSIKVTDGPEEARRVCHLWLTDGRITFEGDSWHRLKGQTVEMTDFRADS